MASTAAPLRRPLHTAGLVGPIVFSALGNGAMAVDAGGEIEALGSVGGCYVPVLKECAMMLKSDTWINAPFDACHICIDNVIKCNGETKDYVIDTCTARQLETEECRKKENKQGDRCKQIACAYAQEHNSFNKSEKVKARSITSSMESDKLLGEIKKKKEDLVKKCGLEAPASGTPNNGKTDKSEKCTLM